MVSKVILLGRIGTDPELRQAGDHDVCNLNIATQKKYRGEEHTSWHRVTVWRALAEHCVKYLKKGSLVYVEGELAYRSYEKDGVKRTVPEITGFNVQFLDSKSSSPAQKSSGKEVDFSGAELPGEPDTFNEQDIPF